MRRIPEVDRLPIVDAFVGHWTEADGLGTPIEIEPGYGLPQLLAQRDEYQAKGEEIMGAEMDLRVLRAERDAVFGTSTDDDAGVWFRLRQYKPMVTLKLGTRHPLTKTIPNFGKVIVERYLSIMHRFLEHWERVNAAIATPMTLGAFTIADLQAAHDTIETKLKEIEATEDATLPLARAEREKLFGDLAGDERDAESIVARLLLYRLTLQTQFPNQPIADSLPDVFPTRSSSTAVSTFPFNWMMLPDGELKTWFQTPDVNEAAVVFLKEGVIERTEAFDAAPPGGVQVVIWTGVEIVDELDEFEIRSADGVTLSRGERAPNFAEPVRADD